MAVSNIKALIPGELQKVWELVLNTENYAAWRSDLSKTEAISDKALIVEVDGNIVGAIWARIMNDYGHIDENTPSLAMSVLKAYRGMGIGTLLLTQMLLAEKAAGYAKISLSVQKDNYAVKLYRKAGFTTVKETTEEYIMVADLNSICKMEEENGF